MSGNWRRQFNLVGLEKRNKPRSIRQKQTFVTAMANSKSSMLVGLLLVIANRSVAIPFASNPSESTNNWISMPRWLNTIWACCSALSSAFWSLQKFVLYKSKKNKHLAPKSMKLFRSSFRTEECVWETSKFKIKNTSIILKNYLSNWCPANQTDQR